MGVRSSLGAQGICVHILSFMTVLLNIALSFILLIAIIFLTVQFYNILFRNFAPFIASNRKALKLAVENLNINNDGTVYELGCGRADFLRMVRKRFPHARLIGIENLWMPRVIAGTLSFLSNSRVEIIKKDIFDADLRRADAIYCYLNVETMKRLKEKFQKDCRPGTKIYSYAFSLPGVIADSEIQITKQTKLRTYTI
jgi:hypothetical protein